MLEIIFHVRAAGLLVETVQDANPPFQGKASLFQRQQGVQRGHGGSFVIHGAAAIDTPVLQVAAEGVHRPALAGGDHIQMAQHSHHFFALTVFTPAHVAVTAAGGKAHVRRQLQHILQAVVYRLAVWVSATVIGIDAGDADA